MSESLQFSATRRTLLNPSLIEALSDAQKARLRAAGVTRSFSDGQAIQHRGDAGRGSWLIDAGQVRVGQFDAEGEFNAIALLGKGDSYGELATLAGRPRVVDALAVGAVKATWIPGSSLEALLAEDPALSRRLISALAMQLQETIDLIALLRRSRSEARVAQILAVLTRGNAPPCRIVITQQALADLAGTSRMTASQALARLAKLGLIRRGYGAIEVLEPDGLRAAAQLDDA